MVHIRHMTKRLFPNDVILLALAHYFNVALFPELSSNMKKLVETPSRIQSGLI